MTRSSTFLGMAAPPPPFETPTSLGPGISRFSTAVSPQPLENLCRPPNKDLKKKALESFLKSTMAASTDSSICLTQISKRAETRLYPSSCPSYRRILVTSMISFRRYSSF
ncbi:unnamed protein product [Microthlaspi erraticum]|uniref:Uncharacterized protein n=1 Tax=Microthlaspi erraticum TaxID=1685480 RepID=A0A6D2J5V6_9BRAS|nr:unnamed protein product [Microthlaspi erraticum]